MRTLPVFITLLALGVGALRTGAAERPRVVISIDLTRHVVSVFKYEGRSPKPMTLASPCLAVVKGSVKTGTFTGRLPTLLVRRERSATRLDHAILFDGQHALRSSRHFAEMSRHPIAGSVVVPGEFGGMIATVVAAAGGRATIVVHE